MIELLLSRPSCLQTIPTICIMGETLLGITSRKDADDWLLVGNRLTTDDWILFHAQHLIKRPLIITPVKPVPAYRRTMMVRDIEWMSLTMSNDFDPVPASEI